MKKEYESPKAEKMDFSYSETVVASNLVCGNTTTYGDTNQESSYCTSTELHHEVKDVL